MSELISGKEALIAKLNGKDVQYNLGGLGWSDLTDRELNYWQGERYVNEELGYKFRLKPQTIKINGIEVEKPKDIAVDPVTGSVRFFYGDLEKTQQAYEALRSVFNG